MTRFRVVVRPEFFERLDELLPQERTPQGDPSTADFLLHDLTAIIDTLAGEFPNRTLPVDGTDIRVLVVAGMTLPFVAIYVREVDSTTVEVLSIDIDRG